MRTITPTRYVAPLREGGSLPALVEADDDGLYVLKFRGAGQGPRRWSPRSSPARSRGRSACRCPSSCSSSSTRGIGRRRARPRDPGPARGQRGPRTSALDFLPGALPFSPPPRPTSTPTLAADVVWLDALVTNVDRTPRNPNLLRLARAPVADRPRRRALPPPRRRVPRGTRARRRSRRSPTTCCCRSPGSLPEADARLAPRSTRDALQDAIAARCRRLARRRPTARVRRLPHGAAAAPRAFVAEAREARAGERVPLRDLARGAPTSSAARRSTPASSSSAGRATSSPRAPRSTTARLRALAPGARPRGGARATSRRSCGSPPATPAPGRSRALPQSERFGWLVAPVEHDHPAVRGPHRRHGRPAGDATAPLRPAREIASTSCPAPCASR